VNYCTYFDINYIHFGLALCKSLNKYSKNSLLFVLALDKKTSRIVNSCLPSVEVIELCEIENMYPELKSCKTNRTLKEYYWTCTSHLIHFLIITKELKWIVYLDSDQFFYSSPRKFEQGVKKQSICLLPHRFRNDLINLKIFGIYNLSWISFQNNTESIKTVEWWKKMCIEDCSININKGVVGDQKYLDFFHKKCKSIGEISSQSFGAPWNKFDIDKLIIYHFQSLRFISKFLFAFKHDTYNFKINDTVFRKVYEPYLKFLIEIDKSRFNNQQYDYTLFLNRVKPQLQNDFIFYYKSFYIIINLNYFFLIKDKLHRLMNRKLNIL
jgi:hypothetical protein